MAAAAPRADEQRGRRFPDPRGYPQTGGRSDRVDGELLGDGHSREPTAEHDAGDDEFETPAPSIQVSDSEIEKKKVVGRVHYQLGEWMFRDGRAAASRPHLWKAANAAPTRPLVWGLLLASFVPRPVRALFAPLLHPMLARRYPRWTR